MLAQTPPMGWNSWNTFGVDISEKLIMETADVMVEQGFLEAGYNYLVIDDCWSEMERDANGRLVADKNKFPNGMKAVSDYVHSKGLKFGMYSCAGVRTCAGYPGSFDHEFVDAQTFAEWGVDFLKYDYCFKPEPYSGLLLYQKMGMALRASGREILFSACNWGNDGVEKWARSCGAHMYRSTGDIHDNYTSIKTLGLSQIDKLCYSAPGCYNDIDMLVVGMYGKGNVGFGGCNDAEYRLHFGMWCLFNSPLMIGCDIRNMSEESKKLLTNKDLIAVNQDPEGRPAQLACKLFEDRYAFIKYLSNNEYALGYFNFADVRSEIICMFTNFGLTLSSGYGLELTDLFTGEVVGTFNELYDPILEPHDCKIYRAKMVKLK